MIIDNLKDINSVADLFKYIETLESELEEVRKHRDQLLILNDSLVNKNAQLEEKLAHTEAAFEYYERCEYI